MNSSYNQDSIYIPDMYNAVPNPITRMSKEVLDHIGGKRTLQDEYELIKQKKSQLPKRLRDFVVILMDSLNQEQIKDVDADNSNIASS